MISTNTLYNNLAYVYELIADDRNFTEECHKIIEIYKQLNHNSSPKNCLELFAGPAYHANILTNHHNIDTTAIDSSQEMKALATSRHNIAAHKYVLGTLPEALDYPIVQESRFDTILIMRYSLGLIDHDALISLLDKIEHLLAPGGILIIELHKIHLLMSQLDQLNIKQREKTHPVTKQTIKCTWPSGGLKWQDDAWIVTMPIQVDIQSNTDETTSFETYSKEHIYTTSDIDRIYADKNLNRIIEHDKNIWQHPNSNLIIYQKEKSHDD